jgi:uncharacterized protein involved in exopolysaccharide biosynthesis
MQENKDSFNATDILDFLWKYKKIIIVLGILAAIVSSVVSLMIEEKFKSTVTIYPTKASAVFYSEIITENQEVGRFGEEAEAEQMLQILESSKIREKVVTKFNLMKHYEIDTSSEYKYYDLSETYAELISFDRNNKGAVRIIVLDKSIDTSVLIASYISDLFDSTKNDIIHERALFDYNIKKANLKSLQNEMATLQDSISTLTSQGVVTEDAYEGLTLAMVNAKDQKTKDLYLKKMEMTEKYGGLLNTLITEAGLLASRVSTMSFLTDQAETSAYQNISHQFRIEDATVPIKKSYPVRWLIVVISTFTTIFMAIVLLLFYEKVKELQAKSKK